MYTVQDQLKYRWRAEYIFWGLIIGLTLLFSLPVYYNTTQFPFMTHNVILIIVSLMFCRWIFFWRVTPYENTKWIIIALICIQPLLMFIFVRIFGDFKLYLDEYGLYPSLIQHDIDSSTSWGKIIKTQFIGFAVLAIVSGITLFFRLIYQLRRIFKPR